MSKAYSLALKPVSVILEDNELCFAKPDLHGLFVFESSNLKINSQDSRRDGNRFGDIAGRTAPFDIGFAKPNVCHAIASLD
ncbi:MAG: hypothetical protein ACI8TQ_003945 [Planctomycetota bacterium]|jgi:hypothetical protein